MTKRIIKEQHTSIQHLLCMPRKPPNQRGINFTGVTPTMIHAMQPINIDYAWAWWNILSTVYSQNHTASVLQIL